MKYRKKPIVVDAIQFFKNITKPKDIHSAFGANGFLIVSPHGFFIDTLEGMMKVSDGDYIIKGVQGEFYPCKPDIFEATYEVVTPADEMMKQEMEKIRNTERAREL